MYVSAKLLNKPDLLVIFLVDLVTAAIFQVIMAVFTTHIYTGHF